MSVECFELYSDASIIITRHYQNGTMLVNLVLIPDSFTFSVPLFFFQDLANNTIRGARLNQVILAYYVAELLLLVEHLHHCGTLHCDVKS